MFGNKKNNFPARPSLPTVEQISDDIRHSSASDVAFNILAKGINKLFINLYFCHLLLLITYIFFFNI